MSGKNVVKIDSELLKKVEKFVQANKFQYASNKQLVNLAILEFLNLRNSESHRISDELKNPAKKQGFLNRQSLIRRKKGAKKS